MTALLVANKLSGDFVQVVINGLDPANRDFAYVSTGAGATQRVWAGRLMEDSEQNRLRLSRIKNMARAIADAQRELAESGKDLTPFRP